MAAPQKIGTFTIPNGQTDSNVLTKDDFGRCLSMSIHCIAAALTGVCTLQSNSAQDGSGTWVTVQSPPGTDVAVAALKAVPVTAVPFLALRMHTAAGGGEGAARDFVVLGEVSG